MAGANDVHPNADTQQVLHLWEMIANRRLNEKQRIVFAQHSALPRIVRALQRTGPQHLERIGRLRKSKGTLRLSDWADGLAEWARQRRVDREDSAKAEANVNRRAVEIARAHTHEQADIEGIPVEPQPPSGHIKRRITELTSIFPDDIQKRPYDPDD